jgi:cytochrome c biogenesis protein CcmG, thiol:disulfide interchange protein DsbE
MSMDDSQSMPAPAGKPSLNPWLLLPLLLVILLAILLALNLRRDAKYVPSPLIGKALPSFATKDLLTNTPITSDSLRGKPYVLNVWASWCQVCQYEHRLFNQYAQGRGALPIVGLNYKDAPSDAKRWLAQLGNPYQQIAVDELGKIGMDLGVYGAPETYFIDAKGIIRYKHIGEMTDEILRVQTTVIQR